MDLTMQNSLGTPVYCSVGHSDGWNIADLAGLTAGLLTGVGDVTDVPDLVVLINAIKLANASASTAQQMINILQKFCFTLPSGQKQELQQAMQASDLMSPSWWNDLFGGKSVTVFVSDAQNAVRSTPAASRHRRTDVVAKGVRGAAAGFFTAGASPGTIPR